MRIPTHLIESITTSAVNTANRFSISLTLKPLVFARVTSIEIAFILLKHTNQNTISAANSTTRYIISFLVMLSISPTSRLEYLLKLPPLERIASPTATASEENTEMIVSADAVLRSSIKFKSSEKATAKIIMEIVASVIPKITPIAIPVSAECPSASEKNAILRFTTMVPSMANRGVMTSTAMMLSFIKSYSNRFNKPLILQKPLYTRRFQTLPSACRSLLWYGQAAPLCRHTP